MRLEITRSAETDLARIRDYIRQENPTAARQIVAGILDGIQVLVTYPDIGRPGRIEETRELVLTGSPYVRIVETIPVLGFHSTWGQEPRHASITASP